MTSASDTHASDTQKGIEPRDGETRGIRRIRDAADETLRTGREITEKGAEQIAQTADTLADVTRHAANEGEKVVRSGLRAFAGAYPQLGRGFVQMQQSYFDVLRRSMDVAEMQRALYRKAATATIEASRTVLLATAQAAQSAMQPFQRRG